MGEIAVKRDPELWEAAKRDALRRMDGVHSARAMQLASKLYKERGGTYTGKKPAPSQNSLRTWTKQKWKWSDGDQPGQGGKGVYLPQKSVSALKSTESGREKLEQAREVKEDATARGQQFSQHGLHVGKQRDKTAALSPQRYEEIPPKLRLPQRQPTRLPTSRSRASALLVEDLINNMSRRVKTASTHTDSLGEHMSFFRDHYLPHLQLQHDELEKVAVTLEQLRTAYKATVSPRIFRSSRSSRRHLRQLQLANPVNVNIAQDRVATAGGALVVPNITPELRAQLIASSEHKATAHTMFGGAEKYTGHARNVYGPEAMNNALDRVVNKTRPGQHTIAVGGDSGRILNESSLATGISVPKATTREGREAINRTIGLHEARELQSLKSPGTKKKFFSHVDTQPMLNDMNIANTFQGKGGEELRAAFLALRKPELEKLKDLLRADPRSVSLIETLQSGGRISRHGRRHIEQTYRSIRPPQRTPQLVQPTPPKRGFFRRLLDRFKSNKP